MDYRSVVLGSHSESQWKFGKMYIWKRVKNVTSFIYITNVLLFYSIGIRLIINISTFAIVFAYGREATVCFEMP